MFHVVKDKKDPYGDLTEGSNLVTLSPLASELSRQGNKTEACLL